MDRRTLIKGLGALVSAGALPLSPLAMGAGLQNIFSVFLTKTTSLPPPLTF